MPSGNGSAYNPSGGVSEIHATQAVFKIRPNPCFASIAMSCAMSQDVLSNWRSAYGCQLLGLVGETTFFKVSKSR